jgi:hypothetical protein
VDDVEELPDRHIWFPIHSILLKLFCRYFADQGRIGLDLAASG